MNEPITKREAEFFRELCIGEDMEFHFNSPQVRQWVEQFAHAQKKLCKIFPEVLRAIADQLDPPETEK